MGRARSCYSPLSFKPGPSRFAHIPCPLPTGPVEARCHFFHITLCEVCLFLPPPPTVSGRGYRLLGFRLQAGEYVSPFSLGRTTPRRRGCLKPQHRVYISAFLSKAATA